MTNLISLKSIFHIEYGNQFDKNKLSFDANGINFVSRSSKNLGVDSKVSRIADIEPYERGLITTTLGGTYLLSSFVQPEPFYTAQNIKVLRPKQEMSFQQKVFYCYVISQNRFRFTSHGREANKTLNEILVPDIDHIPNWVEKTHIAEIDDSPVCSDNSINLYTKEWKDFSFSHLFNIKGSKTTPYRNLDPATSQKSYPYIGTQATDNGVRGFFSMWTEPVGDGGVFTIDSAVSGYCAYQDRPFSASDHVEKLLPKYPLNKYIAMFLVTVINIEQYRYNYGRKCSQSRLKHAKIKLPVRCDGSPDFDLMERYIKALPYSVNL